MEHQSCIDHLTERPVSAQKILPIVAYRKCLFSKWLSIYVVSDS